jgi:hypothetical protein
VGGCTRPPIADREQLTERPRRFYLMTDFGYLQPDIRSLRAPLLGLDEVWGNVRSPIRRDCRPAEIRRGHRSAFSACHSPFGVGATFQMRLRSATTPPAQK